MKGLNIEKVGPFHLDIYLLNSILNIGTTYYKFLFLYIRLDTKNLEKNLGKKTWKNSINKDESLSQQFL